MSSWTVCAIGAMTVLLSCSRHGELADIGDDSAREYWAPLRTLPWLGDFKLGTAPPRGGVVTHLTDEFRAGEPICLSMKINAAPKGTPVTTYWYGPSDQVLGYETKSIPSSQDRMRFVRANTLDWQEGAYRAETWIGDNKLQEQHFDIVSEDVTRRASTDVH